MKNLILIALLVLPGCSFLQQEEDTELAEAKRMCSKVGTELGEETRLIYKTRQDVGFVSYRSKCFLKSPTGWERIKVNFD